MANIHGMSDYNNNQGGGGGGFPGGGGGAPPVLDAESQSAVKMFGIMTGQAEQSRKQPRDYHFGDFWTTTFCPNFSIYSFPFVIWTLNSLIYLFVLISVPIFSNTSLYSIEFLGPDPSYLNTLQAMNPYEVRYNYQLWRPFTSLFLTSGFRQYAFTTAYLLVFGFMLQASKIKFLPMLAFYLICGATGNFFGAICNSSGSLFEGAQPACFAMFSGLLACFIVNWKALEPV